MRPPRENQNPRDRSGDVSPLLDVVGMRSARHEQRKESA
jgi:hypothetical protein